MWKSLVLATALALPAAGSPAEWAGRLGFSWTRQDIWADPDHTYSPVLDLDLGLQLRHYIVSPEVAALRAAGTFGYYDRKVNGLTTQRNDTYTYSLGGAFLQWRGSPLKIQVNADRVQAELTGPGGQWFGRRTADTGSATAVSQVGRLPVASVGFTWANSTDEIPGMADHERQNLRLTLGLSHSSAAFHLNTRYTGEWSDGSWASDPYQLNSVAVEGSARMGPTTTFSLSDQFSQRTPRATFDQALASEYHTLLASIRNTLGPQQEQAGQYSYNHATMSAPSISTATSTSQVLSFASEHRIDETEFSVRPTVSAGMHEQSLGSVTSRSTGETLSALGRWFHKGDPAYVNALLGPSISMLQTDSGESRIGYGATAAVTGSRPFGVASASASYDFTYGKDSGGLEGWSVRQNLIGSLSGPLGRGSLSGQLQFSAFRSQTPLYGSAASRTVNASATYNQARNQLRANVAWTSGMAPSTGFAGDGLLFTPFDSHSLWAGVGASTQTLVGITGSVGANFGTTFVPGQPNLTQYALNASLGYAFAQFTLSLQDTLTAYEYPTGRVTTNVVAVRLGRSFGGAF